MNLPARRAAARIARRQATRAPGRAVLIMALIGLPIAALTLAMVVGRTVEPSAQLQADSVMGTAQGDLSASPSDPSVATSLATYLPAGSHVVPVSRLSTTLARAGSAINLDLVQPAVPFDSAPVSGMFVLASGRVPEAADEAAMPEGLLHALGGHVGGTVAVAGFHMKITGIAEPSQAFRADDVVVGPGTLAATEPTSVEYLIHLPSEARSTRLSSSPLSAPPTHLGVIPERLGSLQTRLAGVAAANQNARRLAEIAFLATALLLFGTGLIVAAALLIGSNRQLRIHGLMAAAGAERGDIRTVVLLGGTLLGAVGSVTGVCAGLAVALVAHPALSHITNRVVGPTVISPTGLLAAVAMGTLAATAAAILPARSAARVPAIQALAGRAAEPVTPGRVAAAGVVILGAGSVGLAVGYSANHPVLIVVSMATIALGCLLAIPLMVSLVGRVAGILPTTARIATREMTRYGRRTGAAVAAATIALTLPLVASAEAASKTAEQTRSPAYGPGIALFSGPNAPGSGTVAALRNALPGATVSAMTDALTVAFPSQSRAAAANELYLGGADLLQALHAQTGIPALQAGHVVVLEGGAGASPASVWVDVPSSPSQPPPGGATRASPGTRVDAAPHPTAVHATTLHIAGYGSALPLYVMAPGAYLALLPPGSTLGDGGNIVAIDGGGPGNGGAPPAPESLLISARSSLSGAEIRALRTVAAAQGASISTDGNYLVPDADMAALWVAGALLALGIVAVAVALVAAESRRDYAIVVAVGAGPLARRKIVAARAASMALIAAVVAVPAGLLPYAIAQGTRQGGLPVVVPWAGIGAVLVLVPVIAALGAGLTSRQPAALALLRPAE